MECFITAFGVLGFSALIVFILIRNMEREEEKKAKDEENETKNADALAENGDQEAQYNRGEYYITRNLEKAKYWFNKAAKQGSSKAQARLNIVITAILEKAAGISKASKGQEHYNKMMGLTSVPSCWPKIGEYYRNGYVWLKEDNTIYLIDGLEVDMAKAVYWFKKSADQGNAEGLWRLGVCYLYGDGVEKDEKRGYQSMYQAAEMGFVPAREHIEMASGMSYNEFVKRNIRQ